MEEECFYQYVLCAIVKNRNLLKSKKLEDYEIKLTDTNVPILIDLSIANILL